MNSPSSPNTNYLLLAAFLLFSQSVLTASRNLDPKHLRQLNHVGADDSPTYIWPLPSQYTSGNQTLTVNPNLALFTGGNGGGSRIVSQAFERYKRIIFEHASLKLPAAGVDYDLSKLTILVHSDDEELQLGVDESYNLLVAASDAHSVIGEITIEANSVYGALHGLETLSQLCAFDYGTKTVKLYNAPWYIQDKPRFEYRGLLLDTSRHYLPIEIIKQVIESMSFAKLNVLHWHIIDEESFPLEVPSFPNLWKGAYTKWERYTIDDASEIVDFAKQRGINVMAEVDVPGHAESWGTGYPDLWPSSSCREPLDVSKNFTFDLISGILSDMKKIFPFGLFHLGGDEVNTDCWTSTPHVKQWLQDHSMTAKDAYKYFVLRAQEIAISLNWTPVNWEETFNSFPTSLNPKTVVHNWLGAGVCPKAVAKGFRCIYSNQGFWYLDHLDVPWESVYYAEPLEDITDASQQKLVLGGEVCMWGETADASDVQQTIWPRAAAAAERLWSVQESGSSRNSTTVLQRLEYFRCLLTRRGVSAAPVRNFYARRPPIGPGSCYSQ
ncbi:beta-hexosaminidase 1-like isoform X2 [Salvia hispanica]|uniref:beta-hexosaminidase 1-like isoform X2 n=1 Tax=Salvia hispanica TaxID=49212 RepID=UPI00200945C1|nr:beta-hexosaminidase 1-like isoform X2 [Salvia hispanica]